MSSMYRVKPVCNDDEKIELPKCMYPVKSIYGDECNSTEENAELMDTELESYNRAVDDITQRQQALHQRLLALESKCRKTATDTSSSVKQKVAEKSKTEKVKNDKPKQTFKEEGKYADLPGAEMGKVVVRFPPEASGFLHIGHAKAALLNQYYQLAFKGKLVFRFDDTNPEKEKEDYEHVITEDVEMLRIKPDMCSYTSDYFDYYLEKCEELIKNGKAYVDDTPSEQMKQEREQRLESKHRNNSVETNLKMWEEMKKGTDHGLTCCVRAKIDMNSDNGCLRDPALYRCKIQKHPRTGDKYNVYPTYDFACPLVDSLEGITHALRTTEYTDRDSQYFWVLDALNMRKPHIWAYSRLNMMNTVLSKRKLTWFVDNGIVDGWDDPRMPTVRGVMRRGLTVDGLKEFIMAQGSSRSVVFMEWDKIWSFNKKVVDPIAHRYMAVEASDAVNVHVSSVDEGFIEVSVHPKNQELGKRKVKIGKTLLIDQLDASSFKEGENVTFINWGNLKVDKIVKNDKTGLVTDVYCTPNLECKDFKKTLKVTWIESSNVIKATAIYYEHIIMKPVLGKDDDFKDFINKDSKKEVAFYIEEDAKNLQKSQIIQVLRKGYFICDAIFDNSTPVKLISVPDGSTDLNIFPKAIQEWKQQLKAMFDPKVNQNDTLKAAKGGNNAIELDAKIREVGDKIRTMKAAKKTKEELKPEIDLLLKLKTNFKEITGSEWNPNVKIDNPAPVSAPQSNNDASSLDKQIKLQGDKVRELKAAKKTKEELKPEIDLLLKLKANFKEITGSEWNPNVKIDNPAPVSAPQSNNDASSLDKQIKLQGDKVRELKAAKKTKEELKPEIDLLLKLKANFKEITGSEWNPNVKIDNPAPVSAPQSNNDASSLDKQIKLQGDKVRELKAAKKSKNELKPEIDLLLKLKTDYKTVTGVEWKPSEQTAPSGDSAAKVNSSNEASLNTSIIEQGNKIRDLKSKKASKDVLQPEIDRLLQLKEEYKTLTGNAWAPSANPPQSASPSTPGDAKAIDAKIKEQGDKIRKLKGESKSKAELQPEIDLLLKLKADYKNVTGNEWKPDATQNTPKKVESTEKPKEKPKNEKKKSNEKAVVSEKKEDKPGVKKQTRLGLEVKRSENLADWYTEVITKAELIEYYDVSGCYILRPWAFAIWEFIQSHFDKRIKTLGVKNCYFPMFVSNQALEKEKTHIADFAPEVAWVTKSGQSDLVEPIAIRPTSETVMYPSFAKWVQSHRDLPIKINQWCNVVRWEFKNPTPFLRTREFLWQEGHTAHASKKDAVDEVYQILEFYREVYEDLLAIPVIKGTKTEKEKFAGGEFTTTVEAYVAANGRGVQAATSHHLGQNFSKMFEIVYEDPNKAGNKVFVYQNSWGLSTRSIGVMIMVHSDDKGLVLPPRVAAVQVIIIPCGITVNTSDDEKKSLLDECRKLKAVLIEAGIRADTDLSDHNSPGWKYNHWELKGVPIRIELGPKDLKSKQFIAVRRDSGIKTGLPLNKAADELRKMLADIHLSLYNNALKIRDEHLVIATEWNQFITKLDEKCIILAPFCGRIDCEEQIKKNSAKEDQSDASGPLMGAKSLCVPHEQPKSSGNEKCINPACDHKPSSFTLFGRSY